MTKEQYMRLCEIAYDLETLGLPEETNKPLLRINIASAVTVNLWFARPYNVHADESAIIPYDAKPEFVESIIAKCEYALQIGKNAAANHKNEKSETLDGILRQLFANIEDISKWAEMLKVLADEYIKDMR